MKYMLRIWIVMVVAGIGVALTASAQPRGLVPPEGIAEMEVERGEGEEQAVLSAAQPNPFRVRTSFTLRVEETQHVRVAVYNILGQRVRMVHDGVVTAGARHRFTLTAGTLPSGLYFYRAEGATFVAVRRVVLVR